MATSGRAGGRHGPAAIRQVSETGLGAQRFPWNFDMRERLNVWTAAIWFTPLATRVK
jgi:agmatinase